MQRSLLFRRPFLLAIPLAGWLFAPAVLAQVIVPALLEGDPIVGSGNVTRIDNLAVNGSGSWLVECDTDLANTLMDQALVRDGALYLHEGYVLPAPAGASISSFDSINLNENGDSGWNFFLDGTGGTNNDSGVYFNTALVIQESNISAAPEFTPGTPYIGFFDAKILPNNSNQILMVASIDDPIIPTTVDRAIVRVTHDGSGNLLSETVLMKEGDTPPGQVETIADFGTSPYQSAFNDAGDAMFFVDLNGSTVSDGVIYLNNTILAQEGMASPDLGRNYELLSSRGLDLSNSGAWALKANLDGAATDDEVIVRNGSIYVREGQTLPGLNGHLLTALGTPVQIDDAGNVLWFGDWDDPNLDIDTGLFVNDDLLVQEGVTTVNGIVVDAIASVEDAFFLSDNGMWAIFEATLLDGREGAFLLQVQSPVSVRVSGLRATAGDAEVVVSWETSAEVNHQGFNVYRSYAPNGAFDRMTDELIRGGHAYRWVDRTVEPDHAYWYYIGALSTSGREDLFGPVSVVTPMGRTAVTALFPPSPNPVIERTELRFTTARAGPVSLVIYDVSGRLVQDLVRGVLPAGQHAVAWNGRGHAGRRMPAGIYFSRLTAGSVTETQKIALVGAR